MATTRSSDSGSMQKYGGMNLPQWGALGVGGGAALASLFQNRPNFQNPGEAASLYFDKIPETLRPYFEPYIQQGQRAGSQVEGQYGSMTSDPAGFLANISKNYQQSPGYQWNLQQALQGSNNAAAAGGLLGSGANQQQNEEIAEGLASKDYNDWLSHVLGIFSEGQAGLQGFQNEGFGASTGYGSSLANALMNQGLLKERSIEAQNKYDQGESNAESSGWGNIAGIATAALPFLAGL